MFRDNSYRKINITAIGSPMIGIFLSQCPEVANSVSIFDINKDIVTLINDLNTHNQSPTVVAAEYDARDEFPPTLKSRYDAVVFDPPWHNEHYCLFADRAWDALEPLGKVYMSTFAPSTRPEAQQELGELYTRFQMGGFDLVEMTPQFFGYQIPRFERIAFEAQGISITSRGNYGQLVVLQKHPERDTTCTTSEMRKKLYAEVEIDLVSTKTGQGGTTLWINLEEGAANLRQPLEIEPYGEGQTYTSTSRSERRKNGIAVITSDQVAYSVTNPLLLYRVNQLRNEGNTDIDSIAEQLVRSNLCTPFDTAQKTAATAIAFLNSI